MPNPIINQFVVEGSTAFPFTLLNTDQCWPARAADAAAIADHPVAAGATTPRRQDHPRDGRQGWIAAGWRVID